MRRMIVLLISTGLLVAGLTPSIASAKVKPPKTRLTISADLADGAGVRSWSLVCDVKGGNHPNRDAACALLKSKGRSIFAPTPPNTACTLIYGGDQKVSISGVVANRKVTATFSRVDGCEIARYERAIALFTIPNTQVFFGSVTLNSTPTNAPVVFTDKKTTVGTKALAESGFRIRLTPGVWTGSAGVGLSCQPVTVTVPGPDSPLVISCTSSKP